MGFLSRVWLSLRIRIQVRGNVRRGPGLYVGPRTRLWAPNFLQIGRDCKIGSDCVLEIDGKIGDHVLISSKVGLVGRTDHGFREVGVPVHLSTWVGDYSGSKLSQPIEIGDDVWVGYGATILSGVKIGNYAVIAAGSIVTRDVDENTIVAGNPAMPIGRRFNQEEILAHRNKVSGY